MRIISHNWSLPLRRLLLYTVAGLPPVITVGISINLLFPHIRPGHLAILGLSLVAGLIMTIWSVRKVMESAPAEDIGSKTFPFEIGSLFHTFMDYLPALVIIKDNAGRHLYVNSASKDIFGMAPDQLMGLGDDDIWPAETAEHTKKTDRLVLESHQVLHTTGQITVDDELRHLTITKFPIQHQCEGHLLGVIIFDTTAKVRAEESKNQLEQQLIQSQKMEAIGTLAGGIAHDFNNILAAIFGYVELTRMDLRGKPKAERQLDQVLQAAQRAKELVHQILAFSRKQEQERRPLDLTPLIKETIKLLRASLPASIEIKQQLDAENALIMADATQIHQVLMNLSTNAAHAMEAKGGLLNIHLKKTTISNSVEAQQQGVTPGTYLELSVQDTGDGISPAQIERIFEPYYTTKPQGKGTGMGLAVVHGIIKSHGGTINAESKPGQGSTFRILLPITTQQNELQQAKRQPLPGGNESILFVDDEEYLADVGHRMLSRLGYQVTYCTDPLAALEIIKTQPDKFDLLITDMTMPHMSGDLLAMEALSIKPDLSVILCTGYSEQITAEKAARLGIASFLMKPISINDLACTLRAVLQSPSEPDPARRNHPAYRNLAN